MAWTLETEYALMIVALMGVGLVSGALSGLLGVGGGIIIVPTLFHLFDATNTPPSLHMHMAIGTSLATIIPTSISSVLSHHRHCAVDYVILKSWGPSVILGVLAAGIFSRHLTGDILTGLFACVTIFMAGCMLTRAQETWKQMNFTSPAIRILSGLLPAAPQH